MWRGRQVLSVDEDARWAMAEKIEQERPGWMITWGPYTRGYTAYFTRRQGVILFGRTPEAVIAAIDEAERRYRLRPPRRGGAR
jgi:hypothetical protein